MTSRVTPAILPDLELFSELCADSRSLGETRDCGVKALAVAANIPYRKAWEAMKEAGRKKRGSSYGYMYPRAVEALGGKLTNSDFASKTVRTLERELRRKAPGRRFIIRVHGHALGFNGEHIVDWTKGRLNRIRRVHEVVMPEKPRPPIGKNYEFEFDFGLEAT